jgi:hypothetical protein
MDMLRASVDNPDPSRADDLSPIPLSPTPSSEPRVTAELRTADDELMVTRLERGAQHEVIAATCVDHPCACLSAVSPSNAACYPRCSSAAPRAVSQGSNSLTCAHACDFCIAEQSTKRAPRQRGMLAAIRRAAIGYRKHRQNLVMWQDEMGRSQRSLWPRVCLGFGTFHGS